MTLPPPTHPADALKPQDRYRIYYHRVVLLAVASGLLASDPNTEIGHFAFSRYFTEGQELDRALREAIERFSERFPELVLDRRAELDDASGGAVNAYLASEPQNKVKDLILVGASHNVWPVGTSHVLTFPWDLEGNGKPVTFRADLTDFMKRRVLDILKRAGKLRNPRLIS
jgi:hypothetical protein